MINEKISSRQLFFLLIHSQIGIGIITLPHDIFIYAEGDSWLSLLLTGLIIQLFILLFWLMMRRFPSSHLFEIVEIILGKYIGRIIIFLYSIYFILLATIVLVKFIVIIKSWMLPVTPKGLLVFLISILVLYVAKENLQLISRFFIIASAIFAIFVIISMLTLRDANLTYILPVGSAGIKNILLGIKPTFFSFQGFELLLVFFPFVMSKNNEPVKVATLANVTITFFYLMIILATHLFFSPNELKLVPEPILYLSKSFSFRILERPDLIFTSLWIVLVVTTLTTLIFASSLGFSTVFNVEGKHSLFAAISIILAFVLTMNINGQYQVEQFTKITQPFAFIFSMGIPLLLTLLSFVLNKKEEVTLYE